MVIDGDHNGLFVLIKGLDRFPQPLRASAATHRIVSAWAGSVQVRDGKILIHKSAFNLIGFTLKRAVILARE
jgi:hypothetical protein